LAEIFSLKWVDFRGKTLITTRIDRGECVCQVHACTLRWPSLARCRLVSSRAWCRRRRPGLVRVSWRWFTFDFHPASLSVFSIGRPAFTPHSTNTVWLWVNVSICPVCCLFFWHLTRFVQRWNKHVNKFSELFFVCLAFVVSIITICIYSYMIASQVR